MSQTKFSLTTSLAIITFFSLIAYTPLIPFMGFYGDDFFLDYVSHFYKTSGLIQSLVIDRPFNGYTLIFFYFVLGLKDNVLLWHIFAFLMRLIGGYALFFLLRKIWPDELLAVTSITLLFLIYPGFLQQTSPLGYSVWIINLTLWILSLAFTVFAIKAGSKFKLVLFTIISLILQINSFLQLEFFIGMEILRILIITLTLKNRISFKTIKKTFIYWNPYIISMFMFILWRIFIFKSARPVTDINWVAQTYYSNPAWIANLPLEIIHSFAQTVVFAYFVPLVVNIIKLPLDKLAISVVLGIFSTIPFYFIYRKRKPGKNKNFGYQLIIIGLISVFAAIIPIIISGRLVRLYLTYDRYTITSIIGVNFIIVGFILFKLSQNVGKYVLLILVFLSITSHLMNGFYRMDYWDKQKNLWWQLYWRAPQINNNAMLIFYFPPLTINTPFKDIINEVAWYRFYWVDEQVWSTGNLFFNYNSPTESHFMGGFLTDKNIIQKVNNKTIETFENRSIKNTRYFGNSIIISTPNDSSCLWVLDNKTNELPSSADDLLKSNIIYSDVNNLVKTAIPITPPVQIFGKEPPHNWCYYFQKASLYRQFKDWDKLSQLKKEVLQKNLKPKDPNEWLVFEIKIR